MKSLDKTLNSILGIVFVLLFVFNGDICDYYFDYSVKQNRIHWINLRYQIYEMMFLISCFLFYRVGDRWLKMIFAFGGSLVFGSFVDKVIFKMYDYHISDIASIIVGAILVITIYNRTQNEMD